MSYSPSEAPQAAVGLLEPELELLERSGSLPRAPLAAAREPASAEQPGAPAVLLANS